ncbi:superoxide dismutase [Candidatus Saccharibacteria bacterium]|nr:superoxide dismutase [Candidatus Saccharibacteria bacterium]
MFKLPDLTYDLGALAPWTSGATMDAHHNHHHQIYVDKLNAAVEQLSTEVRAEYFGIDSGVAEMKSLAQLLRDVRAGKLDDRLPASLHTALINHGGGHFNHSLFWQVLTPQSDGEPTGELAQKIIEKYGSFQEFTNQFEAAAAGLFGSGWAWLASDLDITTSANQDLAPGSVLIGLDLWEHAYYLDYQWNRADYVKAWWTHVNWDFARARWDADNQ